MNPQFEPCDSCGAQVDTSTVRRKHDFAIPDNKTGDIVVYTYLLCAKCRKRIVSVIEGTEIDESLVSPMTVADFAKSVQRHSEYLDQMAEELLESAEGEP